MRRPVVVAALTRLNVRHGWKADIGAMARLDVCKGGLNLSKEADWVRESASS